ncbi:glutathione S-transferase [Fulvimarina pelagi HTCC2506]|uniref:Glutathione S-transferase n=2 Tax=Fulvimarina pelagi TaxID=217511 RepID=Q0FZJ3_9HYPH|nr:glutathione S-transferase [Fulvimarina pelagi]EAU40285.1 glutathione S-transferase [Fulvimarina pelagi HTCC2506]BAT31325.1 glutathione S-transferase [Fulvimarina pelagi]
MKLFDGGRAPNPRRTRIFLAEKGIEVPMEPVDMSKGEHWGDKIASRNRLKRLPVLELDDGTILTESIAICRYFEALQPDPPLFGRDPLEIGKIEMWQRRAEIELYMSVGAVFRHGHPGMAKAEPVQVKEWADLNRGRAIDALKMFEDQLGEHPFVAGDAISVADITVFVAVGFMKVAKLGVPEDFSNVRRWYAEFEKRPSASA